MHSRSSSARQLDPYSAVASGWTGHLLDLLGRSGEGIRELRRALEIDSTNPVPLHMMTEAQYYSGNRAEAKRYVDALTRNVGLNVWNISAAALRAEMGEPTRARQMLRALETQTHPDRLTALRRATLLAGLADTTRFFDALERATAEREPWPTWYSLSERRLDFARRSPRFAAIVRQVGLDDRIFTSPNGGRSR